MSTAAYPKGLKRLSTAIPPQLVLRLARP